MNKSRYDRLNRSGFPFQLAVESQIRKGDHRWEALCREFPWENSPMGSSGYIDLVLQHRQVKEYRMVIECKRFIDQGQAGNLPVPAKFWFLVDDKAPDSGRWHYQLLGKGHSQYQDIYELISLWDTVRIGPPSYRSCLCVVPGENNPPLLESISRQVIQSAEGLLDAEWMAYESMGHRGAASFKRGIISVIVTNAEIHVCKIDPEAIILDIGSIPDDSGRTQIVPFIKFEKSLDTRVPDGEYESIVEMQQATTRTVFVVNARSLDTFLDSW